MAGDTAGDGQARRSRRRADRLFGAPAARGADPAGSASEPSPPALRRAALVLGVQALGLLGLAAVLVYLVLTSSPESTSQAFAEISYVTLGAAALIACAVGLWKAAGWARGPVVVLQLLLGLVGYTIAFEAQLPVVGLPVLVLVATEFYLLLTPEARLAYHPR